MMTENQMIYCKRCLAFESGEEQLFTTLERYMAALPLEEKCDDNTYQNRLMQCEACMDLINGLCRHCGCFVIVRALKQRMHCPKPGEKNW